ncbi:hypothetical protein THASP1DRAFT_32738 [Thamnocephalis sphaerospora]|uniref:Uncharacterized protein n=1 Tax=Thamnocephalis sphaerospora TaxID=78915 RepID=A0A4P9XIB2_9FUNG|nr:hypothetical protein THASP1DRAFT_32738 [Thamnocephalis sphaerospora]|eukprot:RKP05423.1 hypothetical protein THASP1DRAFT_32738 [Thamnocephalis sphaerospora]
MFCVAFEMLGLFSEMFIAFDWILASKLLITANLPPLRICGLCTAARLHRLACASGFVAPSPPPPLTPKRPVWLLPVF